MFSSTASILRRMGRRLNDAFTSACQDEHLGCERYERMSTRNGLRNGFKPRTIRTSTGQITLDVPQVRNSQTPFSPSSPGLKEALELTGFSTSLLPRCICKVFPLRFLKLQSIGLPSFKAL